MTDETEEARRRAVQEAISRVEGERPTGKPSIEQIATTERLIRSAGAVNPTAPPDLEMMARVQERIAASDRMNKIEREVEQLRAERAAVESPSVSMTPRRGEALRRLEAREDEIADFAMRRGLTGVVADIMIRQSERQRAARERQEAIDAPAKAEFFRKLIAALPPAKGK